MKLAKHILALFSTRGMHRRRRPPSSWYCRTHDRGKLELVSIGLSIIYRCLTPKIHNQKGRRERFAVDSSTLQYELYSLTKLHGGKKQRLRCFFLFFFTCFFPFLSLGNSQLFFFFLGFLDALFLPVTFQCTTCSMYNGPIQVSAPPTRKRRAGGRVAESGSAMQGGKRRRSRRSTSPGRRRLPTFHRRSRPASPPGRAACGRAGTSAGRAPATGRGSRGGTRAGSCSASGPPPTPRSHRGRPRSCPPRAAPPPPAPRTSPPEAPPGSASPTPTGIVAAGGCRGGGGGGCCGRCSQARGRRRRGGRRGRRRRRPGR
ncbi:hypothetical protein MUK42_30243 [Musa troglodytarum]|uniref:Uncharacterized protein n=1 Tax=Musa troglodytarum TaxID=320322 RepID=A0A9E7FQU7_9LILI|nr:hypothetical protein MUK42_30243 [Musa troglodytarum]